MTDTKPVPDLRPGAPAGRRIPWKPVALAAIVLAVAALWWAYDLPQRIAAVMDWIDAQGGLGMAVFVLLYVAATVAAFPASLLTLGAGAIYGLATGFVLVSAGSTAGATAAFLIARYAARDWVARRIARHPAFKALDDGVGEEGWKIVLLTRLSPVFPFNLQNYGYGLTRVPTLHYVLASWVGMIPGTLMYVYLGHTAGTLAQAGARGEARTPLEWAMLFVGLLATIAVTVLVTRLARRKLAEVRASHESPAGGADDSHGQ